MANLDQLPEHFLPFKEKIFSTLMTCIEFEKQRDEDVELWQSNLGISPYLPLGEEYPRSRTTQEPLQFLAQINFAEIPQLADFPNRGIVQFYLNMKEMDLGCDENLDDIQANHRVLYFPEVIEDSKVLRQAKDLKSISEISEDDEQLWVAPSRLEDFKLVEQYMTFFDYRFAPLLFNREQVPETYEYDDIVQAYDRYQQPYTEQFQVEGGHRLGGYANYLHSTDNRTEIGIEDHILLMQLDTDDGLEWCDGGIAHWYIHPHDLKKRDFSKVVFLWASH